MNSIRMDAGIYTAISDVVVSRFLGKQQLEYIEYAAGEKFDIPESQSPFWMAVVYHPDFGDTRPAFHRN
jgi:hypothetical protein